MGLEGHEKTPEAWVCETMHLGRKRCMYYLRKGVVAKLQTTLLSGTTTKTSEVVGETFLF